MRRLVLAALAAVGVCASGAYAQGKITLKSRFAPGEYEVTMKQTTDVLSLCAWGDRKIAKTASVFFDMDVSNPDPNGLARVSIFFREVAQKIVEDGNTILHYDRISGVAIPPDIKRSFDAFATARVSFDVTPDGNVQRIAGLEKIRGPGEESMKAARAWLIEAVLSGAGKTFPDRPVAIGESWRKETVLRFGEAGDANVTIYGRLASVDTTQAADVAVLEIVARSQSDNAQRRFDSLRKGWITANIATGMPVRESWDGTYLRTWTQRTPDGDSFLVLERDRTFIQQTWVPRRRATSRPTTDVAP